MRRDRPAFRLAHLGYPLPTERHPSRCVRWVTLAARNLAIEFRQQGKPWSAAMLAEIFMLRLETAARAAKEALPVSNSQFVPITLPAAKAA